jgi:hypothetical protein
MPLWRDIWRGVSDFFKDGGYPARRPLPPAEPEDVYIPTEPQDIAILSCMQETTFKSLVLPSGMTVREAPVGKVWKVEGNRVKLVWAPTQ